MLRKKSVPLVFLFAAGTALFAANGVPLDVLRDDPYLMDGTTVSAAEKNRAQSADSLAEDEQPDAERPRVFSNAENWPLYPWTSYDIAPSEEKTGEEDFAATVSEERNTQAASKKKDDAVTELLKKTKRVHIDAFYSAYYVPMSGTQTIPTWFGDIGSKVNAQIFSFGGRLEVDLAKVFVAAGGFGADVTWSALSKGGTSVNQFMASVFAALRFRPTSKFAFVLQAGGGALLFFPAAELGLKSFIYPQVGGGAKIEYYLLPILALSLEVRGNFPFLLGTDENYPMVVATLGVGLHL